ncbi:unnamed protein product [Diamesa tonsa]
MVFFLVAFSAIALSSAAVLEELEKPNCLILAKVDRATVHNYYYHNDEDCNSYYQCTAYGLAPKRCSEGLVFDRYGKSCGWPEDVVCVVKKKEEEKRKRRVKPKKEKVVVVESEEDEEDDEEPADKSKEVEVEVEESEEIVQKPVRKPFKSKATIKAEKSEEQVEEEEDEDEEVIVTPKAPKVVKNKASNTYEYVQRMRN